MLWCLQSYYEYSNDQRVIDLMTDYFKWELALPDEMFWRIIGKTVGVEIIY